MYPREAEVLLSDIALDADMLQRYLEYLRDPCHQKTDEQIEEALGLCIASVRNLKFSVKRVTALAEADTDTLRAIYGGTICAVDAVRSNGVLGDPLDPIADIQAAIRGLFPDNEPVSESN